MTLVVVLSALCVFQYLYWSQWKRREFSDAMVVERFHRLFYNRKDTWTGSKWLGIETLQNPNDVWITQELITELRPDFIVEAGTAYGGSAAIWALVLEQVNPSGRVITLDITDRFEQARRLPIVQAKVDFLLGSSTAPATVDEVKRRVAGGKVMVILDSAHHKEHVLQELQLYAPLVEVGSYIVVQDSNISGHPVLEDSGPGPMEAIEEFLAGNQEFESDRTRERLLFTMHPKGYLKRVRPPVATAAASH
jgi:cephalosporin hydroxylase